MCIIFFLSNWSCKNSTDLIYILSMYRSTEWHWRWTCLIRITHMLLAREATISKKLCNKQDAIFIFLTQTGATVFKKKVTRQVTSLVSVMHAIQSKSSELLRYWIDLNDQHWRIVQIVFIFVCHHLLCSNYYFTSKCFVLQINFIYWRGNFKF